MTQGGGTPATFSMTRVAKGPLLFVSGQTPALPDGSVPEGAAVQTRVVLDKIEALLAEHEAGWPAVVKVTYFLRDIADLGAVRKVLLDVLPEPRPAASLVEISALIDPRFVVEIEAIADLGWPVSPSS
jgi:2-iminobutanoate/2-iminopropanoate deaminase